MEAGGQMIWGVLTAKVRGWLIGAGAVLVALGAAYWRGRQDEDDKQSERKLNDYVETRRRIDDATIPRDADAALEWLRKRQSNGDM